MWCAPPPPSRLGERGGERVRERDWEVAEKGERKRAREVNETGEKERNRKRRKQERKKKRRVESIPNSRIFPK